MMRRRSFLKGCGGMVAAPLLGPLAPGSALAQEQVHEVAPAVTAPLDASPLDTALRIDGWDSLDGAEGASWVHVNASWRATWR